jgi:hypothetical protein
MIVAVVLGVLLALVVNLGGILLVGWLGVIFVNMVMATTYPVWYGWLAAFVLRLVAGWFRRIAPS